MRILMVAFAVFVIGCMLGRQMPKPPNIQYEYRYRYIGDKKKPDDWLRKYSIPTRYYVWVDDLGHYEEVTEVQYKALPPGETLKTTESLKGKEP